MIRCIDGLVVREMYPSDKTSMCREDKIEPSKLVGDIAGALVALGGDTGDGVGLLALEVLVGGFLPFAAEGLGSFLTCIYST